MENYQHLTWEDIRVMHAQTEKILNENSKQLLETRQLIKEFYEEACREREERERKQKEYEEKSRKEQEERERKQKEYEEKSRKEQEERERKQKEYEEKSRKEQEEREREQKEYEEKSRMEREERERKKKEYEEKSRMEREEHERKQKELDEKERLERKERDEEFRRRMKSLDRQTGGISWSNGKMAEEFFYNTLRKDKTFVNEKFDSIRKNVVCMAEPNHLGTCDIETEIDIVMFNGKSAAIIETKYNAKPDNIEIENLLSKVEIYKRVYPEYKNHKFYLGVAAMCFTKGIEKTLHSKGIATLRPFGKKIIIYDKEVKEF